MPKINNDNSASLTLKSNIYNVFTPNGDGDNEKFVVELLNAKLKRIKIYDRSGNIVFESTDPNQFWDGKDARSGLDCEIGSYTYSIDYQINNTVEDLNLVGRIKIIR